MSLLESAELQALAAEESVRGVLVRKALEEALSADASDRVVLEQALTLLLERFGAGEGRAS
jgi:hypothetical protein